MDKTKKGFSNLPIKYCFIDSRLDIQFMGDLTSSHIGPLDCEILGHLESISSNDQIEFFFPNLIHTIIVKIKIIGKVGLLYSVAPNRFPTSDCRGNIIKTLLIGVAILPRR